MDVKPILDSDGDRGDLIRRWVWKETSITEGDLANQLVSQDRQWSDYADMIQFNFPTRADWDQNDVPPEFIQQSYSDLMAGEEICSPESGQIWQIDNPQMKVLVLTTPSPETNFLFRVVPVTMRAEQGTVGDPVWTGRGLPRIFMIRAVGTMNESQLNRYAEKIPEEITKKILQSTVNLNSIHDDELYWLSDHNIIEWEDPLGYQEGVQEWMRQQTFRALEWAEEMDSRHNQLADTILPLIQGFQDYGNKLAASSGGGIGAIFNSGAISGIVAPGIGAILGALGGRHMGSLTEKLKAFVDTGEVLYGNDDLLFRLKPVDGHLELWLTFTDASVKELDWVKIEGTGLPLQTISHFGKSGLAFAFQIPVITDFPAFFSKPIRIEVKPKGRRAFSKVI